MSETGTWMSSSRMSIAIEPPLLGRTGPDCPIATNRSNLEDRQVGRTPRSHLEVVVTRSDRRDIAVVPVHGPLLVAQCSVDDEEELGVGVDVRISAVALARFDHREDVPVPAAEDLGPGVAFGSPRHPFDFVESLHIPTFEADGHRSPAFR